MTLLDFCNQHPEITLLSVLIIVIGVCQVFKYIALMCGATIKEDCDCCNSNEIKKDLNDY